MVLTIDTILIVLGNKHGLRVGSTDPETVEFFNDRGLDGNGYTWAGVVDSIARLEMESEHATFGWSPEADDLLVVASDADLLRRLESYVRQYARDESKMELALANADSEMIE